MAGSRSCPHRTDPLTDLLYLEQTGNVREFYNSFKLLLARVDTSEDLAVEVFLRGLKPEIEKSVRLFNPRILKDAYSWARLKELTIPVSGVKEDVTGLEYIVEGNQKSVVYEVFDEMLMKDSMVDVRMCTEVLPEMCLVDKEIKELRFPGDKYGHSWIKDGRVNEDSSPIGNQDHEYDGISLENDSDYDHCDKVGNGALMPQLFDEMSLKIIDLVEYNEELDNFVAAPIMWVEICDPTGLQSVTNVEKMERSQIVANPEVFEEMPTEEDLPWVATSNFQVLMVGTQPIKVWLYHYPSRHKGNLRLGIHEHGYGTLDAALYRASRPPTLQFEMNLGDKVL